MGAQNYLYVVREIPHPTLPRDTIMFNKTMTSPAIYELPTGERYNAITGAFVAKVKPATSRANLVGRVKSYGT